MSVKRACVLLSAVACLVVINGSGGGNYTLNYFVRLGKKVYLSESAITFFNWSALLYLHVVCVYGTCSYLL